MVKGLLLRSEAVEATRNAIRGLGYTIEAGTRDRKSLLSKSWTTCGKTERPILDAATSSVLRTGLRRRSRR